MKTPRLLILGACIGAALAASAQQQQRPGGATGGFPGFAQFFGGQQQGRTATTGPQYNPAGGVGNAMISVDPDTHTLTVIADEETMKSIGDVIRNLDRPKPQVLIKVVFLELSHSHATDIGIEAGWRGQVGNSTGVVANAFGFSALSQVVGSNSPLNALGQPLGAFGGIPPGAGLYQILGRDFQATLRAIAQAGKAQLLSRPSILARDGQPATIVVGQSVPLITSVRYDTFGNAINNVTYTDVGIILKVTPYITSEGLVQMIVSPQTSAIDPNTSVPISTGVSAPVINVRSADTVVVTPDGQTVVIGGLMQNERASADNKIPVLGDIPVLGNLFKRRTRSNDKTELLIFLTPHVVQAPTQLAALSDTERNRSLTPESYSEEELNRFLDKTPVKESGASSKRK
jgi:general secretion pathway protein D